MTARIQILLTALAAALLACPALAEEIQPPQRADDLAPPLRIVEADHPVAAPFVGDLDDDGKLDLIVGQFRKDPYSLGRIAAHRNIGSTRAPVFDEGRFLQANGRPIGVPSFCYTGSAPQLVDFNGDGRKDLISAFVATDDMQGGISLLASPANEHPTTEPVRYCNLRRPQSTFGYNRRVFAHDWDADGDLDLLIGSTRTILLVRNTGNDRKPVYAEPKELTLNGKQRRTTLASPYVADWDADGNDDLLAGLSDGSVVWYRNTAAQGEPQFQRAATLVPPSTIVDALTRPHDEPYTPPDVPGRHARICVVDINADGRLDLLLGDWVRAVVTLPEPTPEQLAAKALARNALNAEVQMLRELQRIPPNETDAQRAERRQKIALQRETCSDAYALAHEHGKSRYERHGSVWLYLRTP